VIEILDAIKNGQQPRVGSYGGRQTCEPKEKRTTLIEPPYGPGFKVRPDL